MPAETRRTSTETLVSAMEDMGTSEARDCLVIYTNQNGDLCWSCTSDSFTVKFGLLEACKQAMVQKFREL